MIGNNGQYLAYDSVINGQGFESHSGYTSTKDATFSNTETITGYVSVTPGSGIYLYGPTQKINFAGNADNIGSNGVTMDAYGNIYAQANSAYWRIRNINGNEVANFGIDTANQRDISLYRPLSVNEIGGLNGNLFIHNSDGTSGMLFWHDSSGIGINAATIYNRTYSSGSTVTITSHGTLGRITSATKYKLNIGHYSDTERADRLFSLDPAFWHDKFAVEKIAERKSEGELPKDGALTLNHHYGLIAEDLVKAGLDEFVIKNDDGEVEGIAYDRLWTVLIPKIRELSNQQIDDRMTISRLEKEIENLKQER